MRQCAKAQRAVLATTTKGQRLLALAVLCTSNSARLFLGLRLVGGDGFRPIDQFDERHRRVVADAKAHLQDPRVAARTRLVARAELVEQLGDDVAVTQAVEREAAVRERCILGQRDQRLDDAAQFLGLRDRGLDRFVLQQLIAHVAQHGQSVRAGPVEFAQSVAVTHGAFLSLFSCRQPCQVLPGAPASIG